MAQHHDGGDRHACGAGRAVAGWPYWSAAVSDDLRDGGTLVVLATYNERLNIDRVLDAIVALPGNCDVLVVDDGSPDGTGTHVAARAARDPRIRLVSRPARGGVGSAHRLGWVYARRCGYARVVTLDADLSHDPADIPRLLDALAAGADVAIGSRFVPGGELDYTGWRRFLSRGGNSLARTALGLPICEYTTSFRAARLDRVPTGLVESIPHNGYAFFLTAAVRLARHGLRVTEIPIHFHERHKGVSKMPRLEILRAAANLLHHAVDRRPFVATASDSAPAARCNRCDAPYVVATTGGTTTCLNCMTTVG
jgi:dolichol-phosphate mannosyltransferase